MLLAVFQAGEALFQTGWFVESLATQVLVIFVIRTRGNPLRAGRTRCWPRSSLAVVAIGHRSAVHARSAPGSASLPLPPRFFVFLIGATAAYLGLMEVMKPCFYRRFARGMALKAGS